MVAKCYHNDCGFCKFGQRCRFHHPDQVCRERACQNKSCQRRHPKPCRNFFLRKYCRFGNDCKFGHSFDCENCENLIYLIDEQIKDETAKITENKKDLAKMTKEIFQLKRENEQVKAEKNELIKQVEGSKFDNSKHVEEIYKVRKEISNLKEEIKSYKLENKKLQQNANEADKEIMSAKKALEKMECIESESKRISDENLINEIKDLMQIIKEKDEEIEISADNGTKLLEIKKHLENEIKELKDNGAKSSIDVELKYSCNKCDNNFKTAGLLRRHIKNEHEIA